MPGVAFLYHSLPAERIPIALTAAWTTILVQKRFEWHTLVATGKLVQLFHILLGQGPVCRDVLYGTVGQASDVHAIQRILTIRAAALLVTGLVVLETHAAVARAAGFAVAVVSFFHL
jgi:hypothetical protein